MNDEDGVAAPELNKCQSTLVDDDIDYDHERTAKQPSDLSSSASSISSTSSTSSTRSKTKKISIPSSRKRTEITTSITPITLPFYIKQELNLLSKELNCPICWDIVVNGHTLPCNHFFCYECITEGF